MDFLTGYGSSGDEEEDNSRRSNPSIAEEPAKQQPQTSQPASSSGPSLWSKLPPTTVAGKKVISFQLPLSRSMLHEHSDDEEETAVRAAKRLKAASGGVKSRLIDFLPAPKNDSSQALGAGAALGGGRGGMPKDFFQSARSKAADDDDEEDPVLAAGRGDGGAASVGLNNEAYRASEAEAEPEWDGAAAGSSLHNAVAVGPQRPGHHYAGGSSSSSGGGPSAASSAGRRKAEFEIPEEFAGVEFKEISAKELRYVDPAKKEAQKGIRSALGSDFENQLRSQASQHKGSQLARSKHQIGTLFHNAKMNEIELLEGKSRTMKTKRETQAKYGW